MTAFDEWAWDKLLEMEQREAERKAQRENPGAYDDEDGHYTPSATRGDYGPSNPWDAPGMSVHDFI